MNKRRVAIMAVACVLGLVLPGLLFAGPSIDEVKKNVENLWKPIKESQPHIMAADFKAVLESGQEIVLVDIRRKDEYDAAHLPSAFHIDRGCLEWFAPRDLTDTDARIYIYCRTGARGAFAADRLKQMGYANVTNIYDGFKGWVSAGLPVYNQHGEFTMSPGAFEKKDPCKAE